MTTFYVDRGMAWCTVAGGFIANFLLGGLAKSYGLIMESFQEEFQTGAAYMLLAGGLIYTLMYCLSLVNHYISQRYGSRPVVLAGALGSCISLLVAAYSPNVALWVVAVGIGLGASLSCIYFTVFSVVGQCFRRYLGLANGISVAGVSVGQMAFPALITYLREVYGTRGGAVVISGMCLHLFITAVLMPRYIVDPDNPPIPTSGKETNGVGKASQQQKRRRRFRGGRSKLNGHDRNEMELATDAVQPLSKETDLMVNEVLKEDLYSLVDKEKALVNHYISQRYGSRPVVLAGALGSCISLLVAAYSPNVALWVVAVGIGLGASLSCIYFTVFSVVGQCFRRYLGLANGISVAGVSVGQMAFPALITYLREVYGTRGGAVVISGMCLHLFITAVLMPRYIVDPDNPPIPTSGKETNGVGKASQQQKRRRRFRGGRSKLNGHDRNEMELATDAVQPLSKETDLMVNEVLKEDLYSLVDKEKSPQPMGDVPDNIGSTAKLTNGNHTGSVLSLSRRHDHRLSQALLTVYIVAKIFGDIGDVTVSFIGPTHGTKLGFDATTVSRAIALSGAVDLVSRLGVGWLTDRAFCKGKRGLLLASVWIVEGFNALAFAELTRLFPTSADGDALVVIGDPPNAVRIGYYICFAIHGVCSGTAMTQMVVVLCDWVGPSRLPHSLALTMVVLGVLISPGQFALGYLADVTGSFVWPLRVCCIILLLAGICLLMEFPVRWLHRRGHLGVPYPKTISMNGSTMHVPPGGIPVSPELTPHSHCWPAVDSDSDTETTAPPYIPAIGLVPTHAQAMLYEPTGASGDDSQLLKSDASNAWSC